MAKQKEESVKEATISSQKKAKTSIAQEKPGVQKKSPNDALKGLFKEHLGPASHLVSALNTHSQLNKKLVSSISQSLKVEKQQKNSDQNKLIKLIASEVKENQKRFTEIGKMFNSLQKENQENALQRETDRFKERLGANESHKGNRFALSGASPYESSALEQIATRLFARGFHFATGVTSEVLHKKILRNQNPDIQENLSPDKQSPQHKNYIETKTAFKELWNHYFPTKLKPKNTNKSSKKPTKPKPKIGPADKERNAVLEKKIEAVEKAVKAGNEPVVRDLHDILAVLKYWDRRLDQKNEEARDEKETAKFKKQRSGSKTAGAEAAFITVGGASEQNQNSGIISGITKGIETYLGQKGAELIAKRVLPKIVPFIQNIPGALKNLALKPVGTVAGTAAIGTAAIIAGHYMDKTSREMWDAETDEIRSQADYEHQRGMMKRFNPKAYQLTEINRKIEELKLLKQSDSVKKSIEQLKQQKVDILNKNQQENNTKPEKVVPTNVQPPADNHNEDQKRLNDNLNKMITELKDGSMVDLLRDIRDGIRNISISNSKTNNVPQILPMAGGTESSSATRSAISRQRDALRSNS